MTGTDQSPPVSRAFTSRLREVLTARLPAGPGWVVWVDGVVEELAAGCGVEDPRLTQIRALCDTEMALADTSGERLILARVRAVLDAVSVDATPAQEEKRSRDEYGARPLLGVGVGDDTWPIERATPAQGIDRDALIADAMRMLYEHSPHPDRRYDREEAEELVDRMLLHGSYLTGAPERDVIAAAIRVEFDTRNQNALRVADRILALVNRGA